MLSTLTFHYITLFYDATVMQEDNSISDGDTTHERISDSVNAMMPETMIITEDIAHNRIGDCVKFVQGHIKSIMNGHV